MDRKPLPERRDKVLLGLLQTNSSYKFKSTFLKMHEYDQAQFYLSLNSRERDILYRILSPEELADVFDVIEEDEENIGMYLSEMRPTYAADMLSKMYDDNAADILEHLDLSTVKQFLILMTPHKAAALRSLLHYETESVGSVMTSQFIHVDINQTVEEVLDVIERKTPDIEFIYYIYVVDHDFNLRGVLTLRDLIANDNSLKIDTLMSTNIQTVNPSDDQEEVVSIIRSYNFLAVPVVENRKLLGIVTVDDAIGVIDESATNDYSGLAGVDVDTAGTNPVKQAFKRLPWLITLLFLGMSTASLISGYETILSEASVLAVFISLITGTAGNAGTQSLAIAIRNLTLDDEHAESLWRTFFTELLIGFIIGLLTGTTIFFIVGIWKHNWMLGVAVGLAMMCAIIVANLAGSYIPIVIDKIGLDPAVASGPFISTLSDLTSVLIYFQIAQLFLKYIQ